MLKFLKKNNLYLGIALAMLMPVLSYAVLLMVNTVFQKWLLDGRMLLREETMQMTALFLNLFIFIPYLKTKAYERTGRGILLVTFIGVVLYFLTIL